MTLYKCTLVDDGYVQERFLREGESAESVLEGLEMFILGNGTWEIEEVTACMSNQQSKRVLRAEVHARFWKNLGSISRRMAETD